LSASKASQSKKKRTLPKKKETPGHFKGFGKKKKVLSEGYKRSKKSELVGKGGTAAREPIKKKGIREVREETQKKTRSFPWGRKLGIYIGGVFFNMKDGSTKNNLAMRKKICRRGKKKKSPAKGGNS